MKLTTNKIVSVLEHYNMLTDQNIVTILGKLPNFQTIETYKSNYNRAVARGILDTTDFANVKAILEQILRQNQK